jgi:diguanylate cyclase (GGDEF)-like protein
MKRTDNNNPMCDRSVARALTWRYVIALCLVASLSTAAWFSLHMVISAQKSTAAVVNVSGRQRMLSQRTALFSYMLVNSPKVERPVIRGKLNDAIQLMEKSHNGLIHGDSSMELPSTLSPAVYSMYFDQPEALDMQVRAYVRAVKEIVQLPDDELTPNTPQIKYITKVAPTTLVTTLDKVVSQYQSEGEASVSQLQTAETAFWGITLLLLALEAALIFRPFTKHVANVIGKLESATEALKIHEGHLEAEVKMQTAELEQKNMALAESKEELRKIAYYDSLTRLPNRRMLNDRLDKAIALSKRTSRYGALIFIDLDNFKSLNDKHGHVAGDLLLVEAAKRLTKVMREMDTVARFGGDEFVVMLSELEENESEATSHALTVAEKILVTLNEPYELIIVDGVEEKHITHICSGSIGVAMFSKNDISIEELLQSSDAAMYRAKEAGKNTIKLFD